MAYRFFRCSSCSHRMRFGAAFCGKCHAPAGMRNRRLPYVLGIMLVPMIALVLMLY